MSLQDRGYWTAETSSRCFLLLLLLLLSGRSRRNPSRLFPMKLPTDRFLSVFARALKIGYLFRRRSRRSKFPFLLDEFHDLASSLITGDPSPTEFLSWSIAALPTAVDDSSPPEKVAKVFLSAVFLALEQCLEDAMALEEAASYWHSLSGHPIRLIVRMGFRYWMKQIARGDFYTPEIHLKAVFEDFRRSRLENARIINHIAGLWYGQKPGARVEPKDVSQIVEVVSLHRLAMHSVLQQHPVPSHFSRNWLSYSVSAVCITAGCVFVYRNRVTLQRTVAEGVQAVQRFVADHLVDPIRNLYSFIRYDAHDSLIDPASVRISEQSLNNMVRDYCLEAGLPVPANKDALKPVMESYTQELRHPIYNVAFGHMARLMLIQVQKQKVDLERSLAAMDRLLRSNEVNFELLALIPFAVLAGGVLYGAITRQRAENREIFDHIRRSLIHCERILNRTSADPTALSMPPVQEGTLLIEYFQIRRLLYIQLQNHSRGRSFYRDEDMQHQRHVTYDQGYNDGTAYDLFVQDLQEVANIPVATASTAYAPLTIQQRLNAIARIFRSQAAL